MDDIFFTIFGAGALGAIFGLCQGAYRNYVDKHPELNETPAMREKRREAERVAAALRYGLESGRLSPEEYERLYAEKVEALKPRDADASSFENGGASQDGSRRDGD